MAHDEQKTAQTDQAEKPAKALYLPPEVVGLTAVSQLIRELESIEDVMLQLKVKQEPNTKLPNVSGLMNGMATSNELNLLQEADRKKLDLFLNAIKERAPSMHISFSAEPSQAFLAKLVTWLRQEINPYTLVTVGLQPNIGVGCILRSLNKYFDMSLRQSLNDHKADLAALLDPATTNFKEQTNNTPAPEEKPQPPEEQSHQPEQVVPQGAAA
jgi:F0F1-type ATP synthase delta subunit